MKHRSLVTAFYFVFFVLCFTFPAKAELLLTYDHPANDWQSEALPIGNGRLGAMIFGDPQHEHIQLNESSLWTGDEKNTGNYQNLGDLHINFAHGPISNYHRELNLSTAIHSIHYSAGGIDFQREYFASHPQNALVFHFTASKLHSLNGSVNFKDAHNAEIKTKIYDQLTKKDSATYVAIGKLENGLSYKIVINITQVGGVIVSAPEDFGFSDADALTITIDAGTTYSTQNGIHWRSDELPDRIGTGVSFSSNDYKKIRDAHIADYQSLFNRMSLSLGSTDADTAKLPTSERLAKYTKGAPDPELEALLYQYGRYLLISSSSDALPANLQGLWNNSNTPPWRSDYHSNINIQMNYWPAEVANLSECTQPLFNWINSIRAPRTAATHDYYLNQIDPKIADRKSVRGWTLQTENGVFGGGSWKWNPPASAWLCLHLYEHYNFTQDKTFLAETAYPIMKEVCQFWQDHLITLPDGTLVTPDGWSPEHGPQEKAVTYDQEIIYNLFTNTIAASTTLDIDPDFRQTLTAMRNKLPPLKIGKWHQLQEWSEDRDDPQDNHRHISHLFALFPGNQITPDATPDLAAAAKISLTARGDESTGWAMAWRALCWARLLDAEHAYTLLHNFIHLTPANAPKNMSSGGGVYANLLCAHPPYQIDGNFGYVAAVSELLLQSQNNSLHLLPVLPAAWPTGSITGLRARGNITVNLTWQNQKLTTATLLSPTPTTCKVDYQNHEATINLSANTPVTLNADLQPQ